MRTARMPGYCCASGYCLMLRNTLVPGSRPSCAVCGKPTCATACKSVSRGAVQLYEPSWGTC